MSIWWSIFWLLVAWRVIVLLRRRRRWGQPSTTQPLRRRPRRHHRLGDARRRRIAREQARGLADVLCRGRHDAGAYLSAGVVLQPGEVTWGGASAWLSVWSTEVGWVTYSRVTWWGRRGQSSRREVTSSGWREHGRIDWLITSDRIVGRAPVSGELISIWWGGLSGAQVDLDRSVIKFDGINGWRAQVGGVGLAPIAVAAVAACHGPAPWPTTRASPVCGIKPA